MDEEDLLLVLVAVTKAFLPYMFFSFFFFLPFISLLPCILLPFFVSIIFRLATFLWFSFTIIIKFFFY